MADLTKLKELTKELAEEIHDERNGLVLSLVKMLLDNIDTYAMIIDSSHTVLYTNPSLKRYMKCHNLDLPPNVRWFEIWKSDKPVDDNPHCKALLNKKVIIQEVISPITKIHYDVTVIPLIYDGVSGTICFIKPMNE